MLISSLAIPMILLLIVIQIIGTIFWVRPIIRVGLPLYSNILSIPKKIEISEIINIFRSNKLVAVVAKPLSATELGFRCNFFSGFTGVQGILSISPDSRFKLLLSWPTVIIYLLFIYYLWHQSSKFGFSIIPLSFILLVIPMIDVGILCWAIKILENNIDRSV
ncbi:MAG: hypothetical protein ABTR07_11510 [Candidatus Competibacter denitrificans]